MNKTIMIVEDDKSFHDLYAEMLKDTGYVLIHTYDGDEALSKLEDKKPDLIIIDLLLNMITGDTLFLYIKSMPEYDDIPVIVISSYPKRDYKNLKDVNPSLVFLEKTYLTKERLLEEVEVNIT